MTTTYAPDLAPDLRPRVVQWLPAHRTGSSTGGYLSLTGVAVAAVAVGALAVGAVAVGAMAIGRLSVGRPRFRVLDIDELNIGRLKLKRRPF